MAFEADCGASMVLEALRVASTVRSLAMKAMRKSAAPPGACFQG